jgi:hypothetical protein
MSKQQPNSLDQNAIFHLSPHEVGDLLHSPERELLTLGQLVQLLSQSSTKPDNYFLLWLSQLAQLASSESAQAFSRIATNHRIPAVAEEDKLGWGLFFSSLKRERLAEKITDETTMSHLSELLWERHTAP